MKVRFARWFAFSWFAVGGLVTIASLGLALAIAPGWGVLIVGGLGAIACGWVFLDRVPYFVLTGTEFVMPIQPAFRQSLDGDQLAMNGNRLVVVPTRGKAKKLPVYRWYARREDWDQLVDAIGRDGSGVSVSG